ncbi:alcohol oxidase [Rickenella mellea]|uniref:Alcohol oxidase n=1 Tax=Rickenella mellea TaxID=50990 RepID=A0A4Y7PKF6_9AGAM|nr:alcohol oxidase [Rickenella mellea]
MVVFTHFVPLAITSSLLTLLPVAQASSASFERRSLTATPSDVNGKTFSYIVVGGGTAGLTVAVRLSEDATNTVVVLEAGDAHLNEPQILVPFEVGSVYGNPDYDWLYQSVPQTHAGGAVVNLTRGKVLGGSSALNAMLWDRSAEFEYNNIAQLGNSGWDWSGLLPYFKKPENFTHPDPAFAQKWNLTFDDATRGHGGPIQTTFPNAIPDAELPTEPAALSLGLNIISDPMSGTTKGAWRSSCSIDPVHRTRSYSVNAYFTPNQGRSNLVVLTGAHVTKINWASNSTSAGLTASGVSFITNGTTYTVGASREVILSASSIGSPQVLELSGVGSKSLLSKIGINSTIDLPGVGENMQEHIYSTVSYAVKSGVETLDPLLSNQTLLAQQEALFGATPATGDLGYTASGITFLGLSTLFNNTVSDALLASLNSQIASTNRTKGQVQQQSIQVQTVRSADSSVVEVLVEGIHIGPDTADPNTGYVTFLTLLQQPFSRGSTHVPSANALDHPNIDPNYFSIDFDLTVLSTVAKYVRTTLSKTVPYANIIAEEQFPGSSVKTDDDWKAYVKSNFNSQGHTTGTCSMMPQAKGGVVDANLKVYGTTNVRVVDLSIMPQQFSGHPQALVYTIAEKGADIIKNANK